MSALTSCAAPAGNADGAPFDLEQIDADSAELTAGVKAALLEDPRVTAASIRVIHVTPATRSDGSQDDGTSTEPQARSSGSDSVRLEGFVENEDERKAALAIARDAANGMTVIDALQIR